MTSIALRNLWARKLRTVLTALAIVLGVMMIAGTYVFTDTIDPRLRRDLHGDATRASTRSSPRKEAVQTDDGQEPPISASLLSRVRAADGVEAAAGGIFDPQVAIIGKDGDPVGGHGAPTFGASVQPERFDSLNYEGRQPRTDDEVVIDKAPQIVPGSRSATG